MTFNVKPFATPQRKTSSPTRTVRQERCLRKKKMETNSVYFRSFLEEVDP